MSVELTPMRRRVQVQANEIVGEYVQARVVDLPARLRRRAKVLRACEPLLAEELERRAGQPEIAHRERPQ